jgi:hypothetical protein
MTLFSNHLGRLRRPFALLANFPIQIALFL